MELVNTGWHVLSAFAVFLLGLLVSHRLAGYFMVAQTKSVLIYIWHTVFCVIYCLYVVSSGGDAIGYYNHASEGFVTFGVGTSAVVNINAFFVYYLGFSFLGVSLLNNIYGYIGLVAVYGCLSAAVSLKSTFWKKLVFLIVLLPSMSFWSSALGKDSLSFMATGLVLWASLDIKKRTFLLVFSIFLMFLVRPHMAGLLIIAFTVAHVASSKSSPGARLVLGFLGVVAAAIMIPFALKYAGVEGGDVEALSTYVDGRQSVNRHGGGSVDIASMSPPMQLFTYLFRPLPFEASSVFQLAASLDNILLLWLFFIGGLAMFKGRKSDLNDSRLFLWVYSILAWILLSMTTANLGISMRQKWMFTPILIYLLISITGSRVVQSVYRSKGPAQL